MVLRNQPLLGYMHGSPGTTRVLYSRRNFSKKSTKSYLYAWVLRNQPLLSYCLAIMLNLCFSKKILPIYMGPQEPTTSQLFAWFLCNMHGSLETYCWINGSLGTNHLCSIQMVLGGTNHFSLQTWFLVEEMVYKFVLSWNTSLKKSFKYMCICNKGINNIQNSFFFSGTGFCLSYWSARPNVILWRCTDWI